MCELYGISDAASVDAHATWRNGLHPDDRGRPEADEAAPLTGANEYHREFRVVWPSGEVHDIASHAVVHRAADGSPMRMAGVNWDVTERKRTSQGLVYLNRVYALLSVINSLIVRARSRDELFKEACRIAVEVGGFRLALLGVLDQGEIAFVAVTANTEDEATAVREMMGASQGRPTAMAVEAIGSQRPSIPNDSQNDPIVAFRGAHAAFDVGSQAIFPLIVAGETTGTFSLYASESDFFHAEEIKLLTALIGDVAFAMEHIDKQDRLEYPAYYDTLTGLANRSLFIERAAQ